MSLFTSRVDKRARKEAQQLLHHAQKVYRYRRDLMPSERVEELEARAKALQEGLAERLEAARLRELMGPLDAVMRAYGGKVYPLGPLAEHVDIALVALILVIGLRAFFFQTFKIPTNSMYPTYAGMTSHVYTDATEVPGWLGRLAGKLLYWEDVYTVEAPLSGEIGIPMKPVYESDGRLVGYTRLQPETVTGHTLGVLPSAKARYHLFVGQTRVPVDVPLEFFFEDVLQEAFFDGQGQNIYELARSHVIRPLNHEEHLLMTGKRIEKGQSLLAFSIRTGDMLFVNRMAYHFFPPEVGDPIVFRTGSIKSRFMQGDKYYIKRLVGVGGDVLEVREGVLWRNGQPIEGAEAFQLNARKEGAYRGYAAVDWREGRPVGLSPDGPLGPRSQVPQGYYYAMGDNSYESSDSRYWGYVPERAMVGRASFIFYPFSHRWGLAE